MRSFRLDSDSVWEFVGSWPMLILCLIGGGLLAMLAASHAWARVMIPVALGVSLGPGVLASRLKRRFPTARHVGLLSIGASTILVGLVTRMAFPAWRSTGFDLTWLGISFVSILAFVWINRDKPEVFR